MGDRTTMAEAAGGRGRYPVGPIGGAIGALAVGARGGMLVARRRSILDANLTTTSLQNFIFF